MSHCWENDYKFDRKLIDGLRCIDNFTGRCLDAQHREFFHMLYAGTKQVIVDLCQEEDYQRGKRTHRRHLLSAPSGHWKTATLECLHRTFNDGRSFSSLNSKASGNKLVSWFGVFFDTGYICESPEWRSLTQIFTNVIWWGSDEELCEIFLQVSTFIILSIYEDVVHFVCRKLRFMPRLISSFF